MKAEYSNRAFLLAILCTVLQCAFSQAEFSGNVKNIVSKKGVNNVQIMCVTGSDTTYHTPDLNGDFHFSNKAGKTKIYAVGDGYVSEINSVNTSNGSKNKVNIAMVPKESYAYTKVKRDEWSKSNTNSYKEMAKNVERKACAVPGIKPSKQPLGISGKGIMTASEINDFARWNFASNPQNEQFIKMQQQWLFVLDTRIPIQIMLSNNTPVVDADVRLINDNGKKLWEARTDNTGKAELWPHAFSSVGSDNDSILFAEVQFGDEIFTFGLDKSANQIQTFSLDRPCAISDNLDIAFVIDATGSMADEIHFIQNDLDTFIRQVAYENKDINIRLGSVFYRDIGDEYVARYSPFSSNSSITDNFILDQVAAGGGDYPEAVTDALQFACDSLEWSTTARARIMYLILDAGAHNDETSKNRIITYTRKAAEKGIRIVPVFCSGLGNSDASLLRSMALATNGTNIFLNSQLNGVNPYIEASGDRYKIETLSELMTRITRQFSIVPECNNKIPITAINITDSLLYTINPNGDLDTGFIHLDSASWIHRIDSIADKDSGSVKEIVTIKHSFVRVYPNPTNGPLTIETNAGIKIMYLADVSGKILQQIRLNNEGITKIDVSIYSSGIYYLKYPTSKGWGAERILIQRN